jgi:hypothetical protein
MVYSWWGDSASVITIVEQQLGQPQAQVRALEKRIKEPSWAWSRMRQNPPRRLKLTNTALSFLHDS